MRIIMIILERNLTAVRCFWKSLNEPRYEKTGFLHMRKQRRSNREADQRLCFRYTDSTIHLLPKYEISSIWPSCVVVQPGLSGTWSETPKTGFLTTRLKFESKTKVHLKGHIKYT